MQETLDIFASGTQWLAHLGHKLREQRKVSTTLSRHEHYIAQES